MELLWATVEHPASAVVLVVAGLALAGGGIARQRRGLRRPVTDPAKALALVRSLRALIVGLCLVAFGAGWLWDVHALCGVALVILVEEMLETSVVVIALRSAPGLGAGPPR
jgi:hypothetical protein